MSLPPEPLPSKDSRKLLFLIPKEPGESFEEFKAKVIQQLQDRGFFKANGRLADPIEVPPRKTRNR